MLEFKLHFACWSTNEPPLHRRQEEMKDKRRKVVPLGTWPGCAYRTCWLREIALAGMRRWTKDGIRQNRTPTISPLFGVHAPFQVQCATVVPSPLTLIVSPKACRVVDHCMSFSHLSSSSHFPIWALAKLPTVKASPLRQPRFSLPCHRALFAVPQTSTLDQLAFGGHPCTQAAIHKHLTSMGATPPYGEFDGQFGISPMDASFLRPISWVSWWTHQLLACKLALIHGGQGETKENGRSLQIGRWQA